MDDLALHVDFVAKSKKTNNKQLMDIIKKAVKHYFNLSFGSHDFLMLKLDDDKTFIHGTCAIPGSMMVFFYYTDIQIGMIALVNSSDPGMTHYCRFRTIAINNKMTFHPGNPSIH
ncbi:MAG: hypothetical protein H7833_10685 [Magnetococcus sp. DMHC-1]